MRESELIADRYRLESRIAAGGMGVVWRGIDTRVDRPVAVKLLHRDLSGSQEFRDRFAEEARLIATLNSPRVANLYDFGEFDTSAGPRSYIVLELVEGRSLTELLKEHRTLSPAETMRIVAETAEGLQVAHDAGIVHRDVKPANILITTTGHVKLVDFGIARASGAAGFTETDKLIGTLAYVSPEHLNKEEPAPTSDVYSLGTVAYQCLSGTTPFASDKPQAVMMGILGEDPPPLPDSVPEPVADVVMRALRKDPGQRWPDATAFGRACREAVEDDPSTELRPTAIGGGVVGAVVDGTTRVPEATPPSPSETPLDPSPPEEPPKRRRLVAVLAGVTVAVLVTVSVFVWWSGQRDGGDSADGDRSPSASEDGSGSAEATSGKGDATSGTDDKSSGGKTGEDDEKDNDGDTDNGGGEDPGDDSPDPSGNGGCGSDCATVPNLVGDYCYDTAEELRELGFANPSPQPRSTGEFHWKIYDQSPAPNSVVDKDKAIRYYFRSDNGRCGSSTRVTPADDRQAALGQPRTEGLARAARRLRRRCDRCAVAGPLCRRR